MRSYFKSGADVQALLAHKQIHFDLSEVYTCRFVQRISTEIESVKELEAEGQQILRAVYLEMEKQQTQCNNESISNEARQKFWYEKTQQELEELKAFAAKELRIPYKAKRQN